MREGRVTVVAADNTSSNDLVPASCINFLFALGVGSNRRKLSYLQGAYTGRLEGCIYG